MDCLYEGQTYAAPLHVTFRLKDGDEVREESVYMGEIVQRTRRVAGALHGVVAQACETEPLPGSRRHQPARHSSQRPPQRPAGGHQRS